VYSTLDVDTILPLYDSRLATVTGAGVTALNGAAAIRAEIGAVVARLALQSYARTELRDRRTRLLSAALGEISGLAIRFDTTDREINRFGLIYTFRNVSDAWKLSVMVIH
jgi:hypothetical protein